MPEPKVLLRNARRGQAAQPWSQAARYRAVGWVGTSLLLAALADYALALYPLGLGSPEWEMATIGQIVQGLPLFSIGLAGIWVGAGGIGRRWLLVLIGWLLLVTAVGLLLTVLLFLTDVPAAIRATSDVARLGIYKLVARTLFLGMLFSIGYIAAGVVALKRARGDSPREVVA